MYLTFSNFIKAISYLLNSSFAIFLPSIYFLANLNISPGPNTKILTYMSYGIPCVASKIVLKNFHAIDPKILPIYSNENELINLIFKLKDNKKYSEYISKKSLVFIQKYKWEKVLKNII